MQVNNSKYMTYIAILLLILQPVISLLLPIATYYDEIIALLFFVVYLMQTIKKGRIKNGEAKLLMILLMLVVVGLIGNDMSSSGQSVTLIVTDIISNTKLFMFAIPLFACSYSTKYREKLADWLANTIRTLIFVMFFFAIISLVVDIGMSDEVRFGIRSFKFVFTNPAGLNTYFYSFMVVFSATIIKNGRIRRHTNLFMAMAVITWILTLRSRAIAFACIYILVYIVFLYLVPKKTELKFKWSYVPPIMILALLIGWPAFEEYYLLNSRQARYVLLRTAIAIAKDYLPFGTGFATFGTAASATHYSSIYGEYGLASIWGVSADSSFFIMDQYWCGILGQFGVLGMLIMAYLIYKLYRELLKRSRGNRAMMLASVTLIYTSLLASISAASYIQSSIFISVYVLFILTAPQKQREINESIV